MAVRPRPSPTRIGGVVWAVCSQQAANTNRSVDVVIADAKMYDIGALCWAWDRTTASMRLGDRGRASDRRARWSASVAPPAGVVKAYLSSDALKLHHPENTVEGCATLGSNGTLAASQRPRPCPTCWAPVMTCA